jgi:hypothetical protein
LGYLILPKAQITTNVFERVLDLRVNAGTPEAATATGFTLDVDGREYLITAKHVVAHLKDEDSIDILANEVWVPFHVKIFRCEDPVDIAVLIPPRQLTINFDLPFDRLNYQFGQEAYFLGFPYGIAPPSLGANGPYPLAIVKRGTIAGTIPIDIKKKAGMVLLDGYNNPGFSGGPIVYRDFSQSTYVMKLIGVISGFVPEIVPAMVQHDINKKEDASPVAKSQPWRISQHPNGKYFEYVDNGTYVTLNTGIVQGFGIDPAIDLIRQHPIGPLAQDLPLGQPTIQ